MFKKLERQLTIFNLLVITALLLILAIAAFIGSPTAVSSGEVSQDMLQVALSGEFPQQKISNYRNRMGGFIYLQISAEGAIQTVESQIELEPEAYQELADLAIRLEANSGRLQIDGIGEYTYLRLMLNPGEDTVLVLQEVISTAQSLVNFFSRIGLVLLLALILIFFASLSITKRALVPIKKAWAKQVEFAGDASHELRTPIAVIQTNLEAATDDQSATIEDNMQWFDNIRAETNRMAHLVNDLLTLSRSDNGALMLNKAQFNVSEAVAAIADSMRPYAAGKGIALNSKISEGVTLLGDKEQISRLTVILLDNAIKYTPDHGEVILSITEDEKNVRLSVKDNGIGIEQEHLDKIFDRFYRVDKARSGETDGAGLGLSLAKWIVSEHSGTIRISSTKNCGSDFLITIPKKAQP